MRVRVSRRTKEGKPSTLTLTLALTDEGEEAVDVLELDEELLALLVVGEVEHEEEPLVEDQPRRRGLQGRRPAALAAAVGPLLPGSL